MKLRLVTLLSLAAVCVAQANPINIGVTLDLGAPFTPFTTPVSIANGDHVVNTVDFLGNETLTLNSASQMVSYLFANDNNSSFTINNIQLSFLGFSGTGGASSSYLFGTQSSGQAALSPSFSFFLTGGQSATFSGFQVSYDVQSIAVSPETYYASYLNVSNGVVGSGGGSSVPDSASSLFLLGLGLSGLTCFRGRRKV